MSNRPARRVALIGWDAADWKMIHPLLDRGLLPHLQSIIEGGVMGSLATIVPALSPLLWTSIVTGHTAERHGIASFVEPDPVLGTLRPVASTARTCKALWNILSQSGLRSVVVNGFASQPAEPIRGAVVSNTFQTPGQVPGAEWPVPAGSIHPAALEQALAGLRVSPADLTGDDLRPFLPLLPRIDQKQDRRPLSLAGILAGNITVHAAATWLMEHEPWDFLAVYYDAIGQAGSIFMPYHPPRREGTQDLDYELYRDVMNGVYCFQDMMLGRLKQLAGADTVFLVLSGHGFHSGHLRPTGMEESEALVGRTVGHGMMAMSGPGVRRDELVFGARLLDIAPTVLALCGLPAGEDMRGRVLVEAFEIPVEMARIPSWEDAAGECGMLSGADQNPAEAAALVDQLIALGYVESRNEDLERQLATVRRQRDFVLARTHLSAGRFEEAIAILEELVREKAEPAYLPLHLAQAYYEAGRLDDCRAVLDPILANSADQPEVNVLRGNLALAEGDPERGLSHLLRAEHSGGRPIPLVRLLIGRVYLSMKRWEDAERLFRSVLELEDDCVAAHAGLAQALLGAGASREAAESALDAIGLRFEDAPSHYALGAALARLGRLQQAVRAFETCLKLSPGMPAALAALGALGGPAASA
jgi:tetratricopeptide (TPR) repeat protein